MASSKEYLSFILEQLSGLDEISCKMMMGEYMLYYRGRLAAYICDDRLLVKPLKSAAALMPNAKYEPPYEGAKPMLLVEQVDNADFLKQLFNTVFDELPPPKNRKSI